MKKLLIKLYNDRDICIEQIISVNMDATSHITILEKSFIVGKTYQNNSLGQCYHIIKDIDHWNIIEGLITIYYIDGYYMEISRIHD